MGDLVQSQENQPQTHRSTRQISRELGIPQTSVIRIIHDDLSLKYLKRRRAHELTAANQTARFQRAGQLLQRFSDSDVDYIIFTDEKLFTVSSPSNTQNDRLYVARPTRKDVSATRLLRTRANFSQSLMVSVGVSKLGCTEMSFVEPGAKINGQYYLDVLLSKLLPAMRRISGNMFVFQQDSAPAHRARETIDLLRRSMTPEFIAADMWPPNSPDLNPVD